MSSIEFIAVLLSTIFALAIANLLSGILQAFLRRELESYGGVFSFNAASNARPAPG
jgi:hypothetical protein